MAEYPALLLFFSDIVREQILERPAEPFLGVRLPFIGGIGFLENGPRFCENGLVRKCAAAPKSVALDLPHEELSAFWREGVEIGFKLFRLELA